MKRNEILGEHKKGTKAVKYNKKPKDHATEFSKAKEKLAPVKPLEESVEDRTSYQVAKILFDHGVKYDPAREDELINVIGMALVKKLDMSPRQARGIMNDEDFLGDTMSELRHMEQGVAEGGFPKKISQKEVDKFQKKHNDKLTGREVNRQEQEKKPADNNKKQGPSEGYNPNSAGAEHRRKLDQSHAADLKARAESPDATERDQQRYQNYLDKKEQMANDYNDRMERESVAHDRTTHRGGKITATSRGIKHEKTDYEDDTKGFKRKDDDDTNYSRYKKYAILDPDDVDEGRRDSRDSYQRDYDFSQDGFGDQGKREFKRREMEHELGHETNNYAVAIDGRTWKVFASKNHAQAVARSLQNKGKKATVHETGAEPTTEEMGADVGKITKVDPSTKKATLTKPDGTSMEVDSTALKPTPDGKMSMDTPDTDELKAGTAVVSTEGAMLPSTDSSSPISGSEENVDLRRLRELAGQPAALTPPEDDGEYDAIDSVDSFNAFAQKQGAAAGLNPEQTAELQKIVVAEPDGSIDMEATMVNAVKGMADMVVQLLELFTTWLGMLEKAKADPAQWSALTPEEQKSIDEAINEAKATLPRLQAEAKKIPGLQAELDQVVAANKASGKTMRIPAKTPAPAAPPVEEADLTAMLRIAGLR